MYKIIKSPKNIYDCLILLSTFQFFLCCNSIVYHKGRLVSHKWLRLYSLFGATIVLIVIGISIYIIINDPEERAQLNKQDRLVLSIGIIEIVMSCTCMFSFTVASMHFNTERHIRIYDRIYVLDSNLSHEFDADLNYCRLLRKNIIVLSIVSAAYVGAICSALVQIVQKNYLAWFLAAFCYIIVTGGPHLNGYMHMNLAEILHIRFRIIRQMLSKQFFMHRFSNHQMRIQRLQRSVEIVKELYMLIDEMNAIYTKSLITTMAHDFTLTTSEFYFIFGRSISGHTTYKTFFYATLCMLLPLYKMILAPIYCERTVKEGKKCLRIIDEMDSWFPHNDLVRSLVSSILFWRMDHKIEFAFGMNIKLNKTVITTVTMVIINYLLILIQFRMMEEMGTQIEEQKNVIKEWIGVDEFNQTAK